MKEKLARPLLIIELALILIALAAQKEEEPVYVPTPVINLSDITPLPEFELNSLPEGR